MYHQGETVQVLRRNNYSYQKIARNTFLVSFKGKPIGSIWKAPAPYGDWYIGRVNLSYESYHLIAIATEDTLEQAKKNIEHIHRVEPDIIRWRPKQG